MPSDGDDDGDRRPFVCQKLGVGYFFLGPAPVFVVVNPQSSVPLVLATTDGGVTGLVAYVACHLVGNRLLDAVAGVDATTTEPTRLPYWSTSTSSTAHAGRGTRARQYGDRARSSPPAVAALNRSAERPRRR